MRIKLLAPPSGVFPSVPLNYRRFNARVGSCLWWIVSGGEIRASSSAEDGGPKMGAHGAGRAACHASSPEWAVKQPLALFPRRKTAAFCASLLVSFAGSSVVASPGHFLFIFPPTRGC